MNWHIFFNDDLKCVEVVAKGDMTLNELNQMTLERWEALTKYNCKTLLFDYSGITKMLNTTEVFNRPGDLERMGGVRANNAVAFVSEKFLDEFKFMETVFNNRGFDFTVFTDEQKARECVKNIMQA